MATKNPITGDSLISKFSKTYEDNFSKIEPSCFKECKELQGTMVKCKLCDWKVHQGDTQ